MKNQLRSTLEQNLLFAGVDLNKLELENLDLKLTTCKEGEFIYQSGEPSDYVYLIVSGQINLRFNNDRNIKPVILTENVLFGYKEIAEKKKRYSSAAALKDSYIIKIADKQLEELIAQDYAIFKNLQYSLDEEQISTSEEELADEDVSSLPTDLDADLLAELGINSRHVQEKRGKKKPRKSPPKKPVRTEKRETSKAEKLDEQILLKIIEATQVVNSNYKLDDVLFGIVNIVQDLTSADRATLYIVDSINNLMWSKIAIDSEIREIRLTIGEGIAGWVAQNNEIINVEDAKSDERFNPSYDELTGYITSNMLCYPINNRDGKVIGVLQLLNSSHGKFSTLDEEILNLMSINCAIAIENSELIDIKVKAEREASLHKLINFLIEDIKQPVLVSKKYTQHLQNRGLPEFTENILSMMKEQLDGVIELVKTLSMLAEDENILRTSISNLNKLIKDFIKKMEIYLVTRKTVVNIDLDEDVKVKIDEKEFYQCFLHLVRNACEAMPDGGKIYVKTERFDDDIHISFLDRGVGIPDSIKNKIFEPLFSYGKSHGSGLGLSITKKIVESHGGKISFKSDLGSYSEFVIVLPILKKFI